jgi:putative acetyltransferase
MNIIIRPIEERDNKLMAEIIKKVFREFNLEKQGTVYSDPTTNDLYHLFEKSGSKYWVAEYEGKLVGGCGIYPTEGLPVNYAELVKFYLLPAARGKGIGKKLIAENFISAITLGYEHLYLESFPQLDTAINLYKNLGFEYIQHSLGSSGHYACNVWMVKTL